jgi:hypothetical protein
MKYYWARLDMLVASRVFFFWGKVAAICGESSLAGRLSTCNVELTRSPFPANWRSNYPVKGRMT